MKALTNLLILFLLTFASLGDAREYVSLEDLTLSPASTFDIILNGSNVTASKPLKVGASKEVSSGDIDLTSEVTGTLPIANGGTGSATQNFVDLTTAQTVAGNKTFSGKFATLSTTIPSLPCPVMTEVQRDAIAVPVEGDCVFNSDGATLNIYASASWTEIASATVYSNPNPSFANTEIFGDTATGTAIGATAYGYGADATGTDAIAVGNGAQATGSWSLAMHNGVANGNYNIALGYNSSATGGGGIAVGGAAISYTNGVGLGFGNIAAINGTSVGYLAKGSSTLWYSVSMGYAAEALSTGGIAIGGNSQAAGTEAVSVGYLAESSGANSIVIGANSNASTFTDVIMIGEGLTGTANDELNIADTIMGDLNLGTVYTSGTFSAGHYATGSLPAAASYEGYIAYDTTDNVYKFSDGSTWEQMGKEATVYSNPNPSFADSEAFGASAASTGINSSAFGSSAAASATDTVALGYIAQATAAGAIAIGADADASGTNSIAIGNSNTASASSAVAIGNANTASNTNGVAIGNSNVASGVNSIALGSGANTNLKTNSIAIGSNATAYSIDSMILGSNSAPMSSIFFGEGEQSATASLPDSTLSPTRPTGSTDTMGGELILLGSTSTGTEVGSSIKLRTQIATSATGTTANTTYQDMLEVTGLGEVVLHASASETADLTLWDNSLSIYLDETTDRTILKTKDSSSNINTVTLGNIIDLDTFYRADFANTGTSFFSVTGDNATPDNAGTGTMSGSLISRSGASAMNGIKDLGFLTSGSGTNDFFLSDEIAISDIAVSQTATFSFHYEYNGADDDMSFIVLDATNDTVISHATNHDLKLTSAPTRFYTTIDIPATCTSIRYGFQRNAGTLKSLYFTNVVFRTPMLELFQTKFLSADVTTTTDVSDFQFDNLTIGRTYTISGLLFLGTGTALEVLAYSAGSGGGTNYGIIGYATNGNASEVGQGQGVNKTFVAVSETLYIRTTNPFSQTLYGDNTNTESHLTLTERVDAAETNKF